MADTYTDELRIRLQEDGANSTTWGSLTNTNLQLIEDAVSGMVEIATTGGTTTLTTVSGGTDQARMAILKVTGVLVSDATIEIPAKTKLYLLWNATSGAYTVEIKTNAGTGGLVAQGLVQSVFCDGTNAYPAGVASPTTSVISGVTGTGAMVRATSPTLVTPTLGTPASGTLTNCTGLPVATGVSGLGTGVATALAVNVGTAGAPVVNGGALGTPSSGVATNLTGTAASLTAGTVTTNANLTGHVTSVGNAAVLGSFTLAQLNAAVSDADMATLGANTFTAAQNLADQQVSRAMHLDCGHVVVDKGNISAATVTFDYTGGSVQTYTATGSTVTWATSNWPPTGNLGQMLIIGTNMGAYTHSISGITWLMPDGSTTTTFSTYLAANTGRIALQSSGVDQIVLWSRDAGATIYGKLV